MDAYETFLKMCQKTWNQETFQNTSCEGQNQPNLRVRIKTQGVILLQDYGVCE